VSSFLSCRGRNAEADQGPRTSVKTITVEGLLREDREVKVCDTAYFTSPGKENCREGTFELLKRWDKCLNANGDYVEK
jgi:hypothetical protein